MKGLNLKVELEGQTSPKGKTRFTVKVHDIPVMWWFQSAASYGAEPRFTALASTSYETWKIFGVDHTWKEEFENGRANQRLEVGQQELTEVSTEAVQAFFGSAMDVDIVEVADGYDAILGDEVVLKWRMPMASDGYVCFSADGDFMFRMNSWVHNCFVPWDYGDTDADEFDADRIAEISLFACRAWNEGLIIYPEGSDDE